MHGRQFNIDGDVSRFSWPSFLSETSFCWFNSGLTRHASVPSPSSRLPPHPLSPSPAACCLQVLTAAAAFWSCIVTLEQRPVSLPRPWHAVRGLMRSYVTRLSGGLSPRVCWFSFNTDASDATSTSLASQRSASLRVINKRQHTQRTVCNVGLCNSRTSAPAGQWRHYSIGLGRWTAAYYDVTTVMTTVTGFQQTITGFDILPF